MLMRSPSRGVTSVPPHSPTHEAGGRVGLCCGDVCFDSGHPGNVQQGLLRQNEEDCRVRQHKQVTAAQLLLRSCGCGGNRVGCEMCFLWESRQRVQQLYCVACSLQPEVSWEGKVFRGLQPPSPPQAPCPTPVGWIDRRVAGGRVKLKVSQERAVTTRSLALGAEVAAAELLAEPGRSLPFPLPSCGGGAQPMQPTCGTRPGCPGLPAPPSTAVPAPCCTCLSSSPCWEMQACRRGPGLRSGSPGDRVSPPGLSRMACALAMCHLEPTGHVGSLSLRVC